jgi:C4-type Zn-finger protein
MRTPFEDWSDDLEGLEKQLKPITCPYCDEKRHTHIEDYNFEMPPLQKTFTVYWECTSCCSYFTTKHNIDDEGYLDIRSF